MKLPVVNHEDYFAKIGDDHKFPINKFGELANYLIENKIVEKFHKPYACSVETLNYAHSKEYIFDIKKKTKNLDVAWPGIFMTQHDTQKYGMTRKDMAWHGM